MQDHTTSRLHVAPAAADVGCTQRHQHQLLQKGVVPALTPLRILLLEILVAVGIGSHQHGWIAAAGPMLNKCLSCRQQRGREIAAVSTRA
jgi:hypothetical protein